jgi:hypothetical protein
MCVVHKIIGFLDCFHHPVFLEVETQYSRNWVCFPPQVKGGGAVDTYSVGPLRRANLNHWTTPVRFTQQFNHETRLILWEITRESTIEVVIKHTHVRGTGIE